MLPDYGFDRPVVSGGVDFYILGYVAGVHQGNCRMNDPPLTHLLPQHEQNVFCKLRPRNIWPIMVM